MSDSVLLRFLNSGLIDVGGDDAKWQKLQNSSDDIVELLKKSPEKTIPFSLIAMDPEASSSDPVIIEAVSVLRKRWPTFVNTFSGVPIEVLRALLLDALVRASSNDDRIAAAFVACVRNSLPFMEVGNEASIWTDCINEVEMIVDRHAEREWSTPAEINVGELKIEKSPDIRISPELRIVNRETLKAKIFAAAGPNPGVQNANPYWPNNPQPWSQPFAQQLSDAVAEAIDAVAKGNAVAPIDISTPFQQVVSAVNVYVNGALDAFANATAGLQRRTSLIWWKQALFSPSAQVSYRDLSFSTSAALMAFDLHKQLPIFSPASVSAFLVEAVRSLQDDKDFEKKTIRDLIEETSKSKEIGGLKSEVTHLLRSPGSRCLVVALLAHPERLTGVDSSGFRNLVGIPAQSELTFAQWASWIFRELQAARATIEVPKRRGTKEQV